MRIHEVGKSTALCLLFASAAAGNAAAQRAKVGEQAPDFVLKNLNGESIQLSAFHGHPTVLKFWATWCPSCRVEMPDLLAARQQWKTEGLVVLAIDSDERPEKMQRWLRANGVDPTLPALIDVGARVQSRYRVPVLPTTVFVDSAGIVRVLHTGIMSHDELIAGLRTILPSYARE